MLNRKLTQQSPFLSPDHHYAGEFSVVVKSVGWPFRRAGRTVAVMDDVVLTLQCSIVLML